MIRAGILALALATGFPLAAQDVVEPLNGNREMAQMFAADQGERKGDIDWDALARHDIERRRRVRELFETGALTSGPDFYAAAFIFQHGREPDDYLLAHAFAVRSLALGLKQAEWIAAASMDRYLLSIGRRQIYGTQYQADREGNGAKQQDFDMELLTDQLQIGTGVNALDRKGKQAGQGQAGREPTE